MCNGRSREIAVSTSLARFSELAQATLQYYLAMLHVCDQQSVADGRELSVFAVHEATSTGF